MLDLIAKRDAIIAETAKIVKANNPADLASRASAMAKELADKKRELDAAATKLAASQADSLIASAASVGSVKLIAADLGDMSIDSVRAMCDTIKDKLASSVTVFAVHSGDKLNFVSACSKDAVAAGANAGKLVGAVAAVTGGKGGGRPDNAMAGGRDLDKVADALAEAASVLAGMVK